jgi:hypothetical protein
VNPFASQLRLWQEGGAVKDQYSIGREQQPDVSAHNNRHASARRHDDTRRVLSATPRRPLDARLDRRGSSGSSGACQRQQAA